MIAPCVLAGDLVWIIVVWIPSEHKVLLVSTRPSIYFNKKLRRLLFQKLLYILTKRGNRRERVNIRNSGRLSPYQGASWKLYPLLALLDMDTCGHNQARLVYLHHLRIPHIPSGDSRMCSESCIFIQ